MILFCLHNNSSTLNVLKDHNRCAISILTEQQKNLAKHFAYAKGDKFENIHISLSPNLQLPVIPNCQGWLECEINSSYVAGDHTIFICKVVDLYLDESKEPLIYYNRKFTKL